MDSAGAGGRGTDDTGVGDRSNEGDESSVGEGTARLARAGAVASLVLAIVVFAPAVLVTGVGNTLGAYFTAGPFGLTAVGFLAIVAVVVFLSTTQPHTDATLVSGVVVVVAVAAAVLAVVWVLLLDQTVLFSFPARYSWLATHRWLVVAAAALVAVVAGVQARTVL